MGIFGLFGKTISKRWQCYHHDNGDIEYIPRIIIGQACHEIDDKGDPVASWADFYQNNYPFNGYKNVPSCAIAPAFGRHYHLELHNVLPDELRPKDDGTLDCDYISVVADTRASEINKAPKPRTIWEKVTIALMGAVFIELIIWGIQIATG
jgi:hypothetical protein